MSHPIGERRVRQKNLYKTVSSNIILAFEIVQRVTINTLLCCVKDEICDNTYLIESSVVCEGTKASEKVVVWERLL